MYGMNNIKFSRNEFPFLVLCEEACLVPASSLTQSELAVKSELQDYSLQNERNGLETHLCLLVTSL
jgi:hypothetical protein